VFIRSASLGALLSIALAAPAAAVAPAAAPATGAAAPAAQSVPTRAAIVRNLDTTFKGLDSNGDGFLSTAELSAAEAKGLQQRQAAVRARVEAEFNKLDTNRDGSLTKAEFLAATPQAKAGNPSNLLAQLDKNKDGKVSADEYRTPILSRFDRADTNKDGTLSPAERQAAAKTAQK